MSELIGQQLGQYEINAMLGKGGMATVYRARQISIGRDVALKVIDPTLARNADFLKRFEREARTIAGLSHAHILKVFDYGQQNNNVFLVMELLRGGSLSHVLKRGRIPLNIISWLLDQVSSALDYAHARSIVHRDLKPHNLLFDDSRNIFLTDFGLAKLLDEVASGELTRTGLVVGTPAYMAPEQWKNETIDHRADIYSLGVILFEMLSGKLPFTADTPHRMMYLHINATPPSILSLRPDLPPIIGVVLEQALAKEPSARFSSAGKLAAAFKRSLSDNAARYTGPLGTSMLPPRGVAGMTGMLPSVPTQNAPAVSAAARQTASVPAVSGNVMASSIPNQITKQTPPSNSSVPNVRKLTLSPGMRRVDAKGIPQVWVPAGVFRMGAVGDPEARPDEQPEHVVSISQSFWIDQYPITNAAFQAFCDDGGYLKREYWTTEGWRWLTVNSIKGPGNYPNFTAPDQPRVGVSWHEADAYAHWRGGRLPTEAEWEYVVRGPQSLRYPWGNDWQEGRSNVRSKRTVSVTAFPESASWVKAYDLVGNVWEWCADWYSETYYQPEGQTDPTGPSEGKGKVLRGGSWRQEIAHARGSARRYDGPTSRDDYIGFRVVFVPTVKP
ncbi:MAG: SUMF1/EgtB/PvdO family nonheme iron enzyme [Anaerolineae bacterium]|nr:SUMF1/EgtB/PvdO family nonheme iron enzyme [Anaerolineae bacterium]